MKTVIVYADKGVVKVFIDDMGSIDDISVVKQDGRVYVDVDILLNVLGFKIEDPDELMQVYTYRRL